MPTETQNRNVIIGGGPAGLASALTLSQKGLPAVLLEQDDEVGGLCRTYSHRGHLFDVGGHRFLTESAEVNRLWRAVLNGDLLSVRRKSRIYYHRKFYKYPLSFPDALKNLGALESLRCAGSYLRYRLLPAGDEKTFEGWACNRFGRRLFEIFFDRYTQKLWGLPCHYLSSDWAEFRIKDLSLITALREALLGPSSRRPKTFYDEFLYPRFGPGQFISGLRSAAEQGGAEFLMKAKVTGLRHDGLRVRSVEFSRIGSGKSTLLKAKNVISSMPLTSLAACLNPPPPPDVLEAAAGLRFRNFISVNVIVNRGDLFPDQWIYIHAPEVRLSRVQNYRNWSPAMAGSGQKTPLGLEYFCDRDDDLWRSDDSALINLAVEELEKIGLSSPGDFVGGFVVRREYAYPVYDLEYRRRLFIIREYLNRFTNLQTAGRAGLFRYINSDWALLSGIRAAENIAGPGKTDLWIDNPGGHSEGSGGQEVFSQRARLRRRRL